MAIKEVITLEGVQEVEAQLKKLAATGEKSLQSFSKIGGQAGDTNPFDKLVDGAKKAGLELNNTSGHTNRFSEALRVLRPILNEAGVSVGNLSSFSRSFGVGIAALAASITGTAVVALVSLSEETAKARQRLNDLLGNAGAGGKAFDALKQSAAGFGTTVKQLLPGLEGMLTALNAIRARSATGAFIGDVPDAANNAITAQKAFNALFAALRAGGADEATATKAIAEFNAELRATGQVTGQMVQKLTDAAPGAAKFLADAFGQAGKASASLVVALDKVPLAGDRAAQGLARLEPATKAAFDDRPVKTFSENISQTAATVERSVQEIADSTNKIGQESKTNIAGVFSELTVDATGTMDTLRTTFAEPLTINTTSQQTFDALVAGAQSAWDRMNSIFQQNIRLNITGQIGDISGVPFASGGMVRGAGTTTSDSILAFLSNREFVVNARAVTHYGPELFAALNAMRLPRDFISRFSMGGLARALSGNRFASGGQVNAQQATSTLVLNIGGRSFETRADQATLTSLRRFAINSQLASIGRKPGFVR